MKERCVVCESINTGVGDGEKIGSRMVNAKRILSGTGKDALLDFAFRCRTDDT